MTVLSSAEEMSPCRQLSVVHARGQHSAFPHTPRSQTRLYPLTQELSGSFQIHKCRKVICIHYINYSTELDLSTLSPSKSYKHVTISAVQHINIYKCNED